MDLKPSTALVPTRTEALSKPLSELHERAQEHIRGAKAGSTRHAYEGDWNRFRAWCTEMGVDALPPNPAHVAAYLTNLGPTHRMSTVERALAGIAFHFRKGGYDWETPKAVTEMLRGMRNRYGVRRTKKAPAEDGVLRKMVGAFGSDLAGVRNRAILTLGWMGAFRRSEIVSFDVEDISFAEGGLVVFLRKSKTDQERKGVERGIPYASDMALCPVESVRSWLRASGVQRGALFRAFTSTGTVRGGRLSDRSVANIVKLAASRVGLDPKIYSGHSLRAGFATTASREGRSEAEIMRQTGHTDAKTAREYIRHGSLFINNAAKGLL